MSVDARLQEALSPCGLPVYPEVYEGEALEYVVTNWTALPELHAGDVPGAGRYLVQVHYYLPRRQNPNAMIRTLCLELIAAGFTAPSVVPAHEADGQHWVLECQGVDGGIWDG